MRYAVGIPLTEIRLAHAEAKRALLEEVAARTGVQLEPDVLTVGFARRATGYKRAELLFTDLERLRHIDRNLGPLQLLFAGKAHPRDEGGKAIIRRIREASARLAGEIPVIYLEDYDMALAAKLCAGVDLWLNTPQKPEEASGTSGMKAALNGVPSLSVLDGWWIEGHVEGVTGCRSAKAGKASRTRGWRRTLYTASSSRRSCRSSTAAGCVHPDYAFGHLAERLLLQRSTDGYPVRRHRIRPAEAGYVGASRHASDLLGSDSSAPHPRPVGGCNTASAVQEVCRR